MEKEEPAVVRRKSQGDESTETKPTLENMDTISGDMKDGENVNNKKPSCKAYTKEVSQWLMQYRTHQWMHYCSQHALMMAPYFFGSPFMPPGGGDTPTTPGFPPMGGVVADQGPAPFLGQQMQVPPVSGQFPFTFQQPQNVPAAPQQQQQQQQQQQAQPQIPQLIGPPDG